MHSVFGLSGAYYTMIIVLLPLCELKCAMPTVLLAPAARVAPLARYDYSTFAPWRAQIYYNNSALRAPSCATRAQTTVFAVHFS